MSLAATVEIVPFDGSSPTLTLTDSGGIYFVPNRKDLGGEGCPYGEVFAYFIYPDFTHNLGLHLRFRKMSGLSFAHFLIFTGTELHGFVAIGLDGLNLRYG